MESVLRRGGQRWVPTGEGEDESATRETRGSRGEHIRRNPRAMAQRLRSLTASLDRPTPGSDSSDSTVAVGANRCRPNSAPGLGGECCGYRGSTISGIGASHSSFRGTLSDSLCAQHCVVAFEYRRDRRRMHAPLEVAISSLGSWPVLDMVRRHLRRKVVPLFAPEDRILTAINAAYQQRDGQATTAMSLLDSNGAADATTFTIQEDLLDAVNKPPVIRLVNSVLFEAIQGRASDVHVQPQENDVVVRQRIDGVLFDTLHIPKSHQEEVISRLKILGGMNIAEKRLPQDGRATVEFGDRLVDLRIATLPTSYGERVVIRFLDKNASSIRSTNWACPSRTAAT